MSRIIKSRDNQIKHDSETSLIEQTSPTNPDSGYLKIYPKSDGKLYTLTSSGVESGVGSVVNKNYVINGNMDFWQRGTSFPAAAHAGFSADRWQLINQNGSGVMTISQSSSVPTTAESGFKSNYSAILDITTADTSIAATHRTDYRYKLEGYDFAELSGQEMTLSFWIRATKTGTNCIYFQNEATDRSYIAEYTVDVSDTWEKKTITLTHDETGTWNYTTGRGIVFGFVLASGTTHQDVADTWLSSAKIATSNQINNLDSTSNTFRIAQVKLERGSEASTFSRCGSSISDELDMCQRYCYGILSSVNDVVTPLGPAFSASGVDVPLPHLTRMRALPSLTVTPTDWNVSDRLTVFGATAMSLLQNTEELTMIRITSSGMTPGKSYFLQDDGTGNRLLILSAEL